MRFLLQANGRLHHFNDAWFFPFICLLALLFVTPSCEPKRPDDLVDAKQMIPDLVMDIRYATTNNFTGQAVYPSAKCYLRRGTAEKLSKGQKELGEMGLGLKVFDCYRPLSVQKKFWALVPDERYVANPAKGSRHNRAAAVDVTLIRRSDGTELPMPTPYDDFTERAHRDYQDLPAELIRNRELLERIMVKHGFIGLPTEWWHFDDSDWQSYDLMDIDIFR